MAAAEAVWTKQPPPQELQDLWLCRYFHCTPSQLDEQDAERMLALIACMNIESKANARR